MKKCPTSISLFSHHIGVRSISFRSFPQKTRIDLVLPAIVQNQFTKAVLAHQTGPHQWKIGAQLRQIKQDVLGSPSGPLRLAANIRKLLPLRKDIDEFYLIDDPVAAAQNTAPQILSFHDTNSAFSPVPDRRMLVQDPS